VIRRAVADDVSWISQVAGDVYAKLGNYGALIPEWMHHPGVMGYVEQDTEGNRRGFILLGFYEPGTTSERYVADLLAIAVDPMHQRKGVGRRLLDYAIQLARLASRANRVGEIQLTVADTNRVGQHLFSTSGFEILDQHHGAYDGGQRAIRMTRDLA